MIVNVTFNEIVNPSSTKPTSTFLVYSQEKESGTYYSIDGLESGYTYSVSTLGSITGVTVTRDSQNADNDGLKVNRNTDFTFVFTITNDLDESDSAFTIIMPEESDAKIDSTSSDYQCTATDCSTGASLT